MGETEESEELRRSSRWSRWGVSAMLCKASNENECGRGGPMCLLPETRQDECQELITQFGKLEIISDMNKSSFRVRTSLRKSWQFFWKDAMQRNTEKWAVTYGIRGVRRRFGLLLFSKIGGMAACFILMGRPNRDQYWWRDITGLISLNRQGGWCTVKVLALDRVTVVYNKRL